MPESTSDLLSQYEQARQYADSGETGQKVALGSPGYYNNLAGVHQKSLGALDPSLRPGYEKSLGKFEDMEQRIYGARNMLPFVLSILGGALAPMFGPALGGALGLSGSAATIGGDALASAISGGVSSAAGNGDILQGALMGGLSGGLGAAGGGALGDLLRGAGDAGTAAADAGTALASAAPSAAGTVADVAGNVVPELTVTGTALPSVASSVGAGLGGAVGGATPWYRADVSGSPGVPQGTPQDWADFSRLTQALGIAPGVAGGTVGSAPQGNTTDELTVTGTRTPDLTPATFAGSVPGLLNTPQLLDQVGQQANQQNRQDQKDVQSEIKKLIEGFTGLNPPTLPGVFPGILSRVFGGGGTGSPDPFTPGGGTGGPGGGTGGPGSPSSTPGGFFNPSTLGGGTKTASSGPSPGAGSPFKGGGAGPAGLGQINVQGNAAPNIYPWNTTSGVSQ